MATCVISWRRLSAAQSDPMTINNESLLTSSVIHLLILDLQVIAERYRKKPKTVRLPVKKRSFCLNHAPSDDEINLHIKTFGVLKNYDTLSLPTFLISMIFSSRLKLS